MSNAGEVPTRKGCLGPGCLIAVTIAVLVAVGISWFVLSRIRSAVNLYTSPSARQVSVPSVSQADLSSASTKWGELLATLRDSSRVGSFVFTSGELQALLSTTVFKDSVLVDLSGEILNSTFAVRLRDFENPLYDLLLSREITERYANGEVSLQCGIEKGHLITHISHLVLNGRTFDGDALRDAERFVAGSLEYFLQGILQGSEGLNNGAAKGAPIAGRITQAGISNGTLVVDIGALSLDRSNR